MSQQLLWASDQTRLGFCVALLTQGDQVAQLIGSIVISIKQAEWFNVMHIYYSFLSFALPFAAYLAGCAVSVVRGLSLLRPTSAATQVRESAALKHGIASAALAFSVRQALTDTRTKLTLALADSLDFVNSERFTTLHAVKGNEVLRTATVRVLDSFAHFSAATLRAVTIWIGLGFYEFLSAARTNSRFSLIEGIEFEEAPTTTELLSRSILVVDFSTTHSAVNHSVHPYAFILNGVGRWVDETAPFGDQPSRHTQLYHNQPVKGRFLS
jgi:hypothetical protein